MKKGRYRKKRRAAITNRRGWGPGTEKRAEARHLKKRAFVCFL